MSKLEAGYKDIWGIAYPLILGNIAQTSIALSDTAFMGRVSETALASIGYSSLFYLTLFMLGFSYSKGAQILIARKIGEGYGKAVGIIVDNTLLVLLGAGLVLLLAVLALGPGLFDWILVDQGVIDQSTEYLRIRSYGFVISFAGSTLLAYYMGIGQTRLLITAIGSMAVINILLNYVLIFGKLGFPALGIRGAAIASVIAEGIALLIMLGGVFWTRLKKEHQMFHFDKLSMTIVQRISNLSLPLVLQSMIGLGGWFIFFTFIEKLGPESLASSNMVKMIYMFAGIPTYGFAMAANTVVSNVYGQRRYEDIMPVTWRIIKLSFVFALGIAAILSLVPKLILSVFTDQEQLIEVSVLPLYSIIIAILFYSVATVLFNCIVSIGSVRVSLLIESAAIVIYLVYIYYLFYHTEVTMFVAWTSEWLYWGLVALISYLYLRAGRWQRTPQRL